VLLLSRRCMLRRWIVLVRLRVRRRGLNRSSDNDRNFRIQNSEPNKGWRLSARTGHDAIWFTPREEIRVRAKLDYITRDHRKASLLDRSLHRITAFCFLDFFYGFS
jgi:hypothetical protein